jgi:hypothetical protein
MTFSHKTLAWLVYALPVLVTLVASALGGYALATALADAWAARTLLLCGCLLLLLLTADALLVVMILGLRAVAEDEARRGPEREIPHDSAE